MPHPRLFGFRARALFLCALVGDCTDWVWSQSDGGAPQILTSVAAADAPRVLPPATLPNDRRLDKLKDLDGYFPFTPSPTPEEWTKRAARLKRQILVANGLWPMPTRTPANAVVHGKVDRPGYTVERVYFESYPGHFVTGSLYRPKGKAAAGKHPAVMCPHGHWPNGRFNDSGPDKTRLQISEGAERFEKGGRYPLQARCVQLARMGCVVFHYDMLGNADSTQLSMELVHRFAKQRPEMDTPESWGFFSTQAELRQQSVMGVQTYNSIRALDWLISLPDVDPARIGVTGASGGGTQTFILCAIDRRPAAAFPAVMVSTGMQGGCTCENCCHLRVGTGNVEIAALIAPRPLGMTGADDWTKEIMTKGLPELKRHYGMLGVPDLVMAKALTHFPHNYNYVSREIMYQWFNKHLKIGLPEPVVEEDYEPLSVAELTVWDEKHPRPTGGDEYERSLVSWITKDAEKQLADLTPTDAKSLARFNKGIGGAIDVLVGRGLPPAGAVQYQQLREQDRGKYSESVGLVQYKAHGEELPAVWLRPNGEHHRVVIWVDGRGKAGLYGTDGSPRPEVQQLLEGGLAVVGADLLYQGEFSADGKPLAAARRVDNPREFAGFTYAYNSPLFSQRVQDVLSLVAAVRDTQGVKAQDILILGTEGGGPWAAAAVAQAGGGVGKAALDTGGFRFANIKSLDDVDLLPGAVKYGDLPGILAAGAPTPLWLTGEGTTIPPLTQAVYAAAGAGEKVQVVDVADDAKLAAAVDWLLAK